MKPQIPVSPVPSSAGAATNEQLVAAIAGGDQTAFEGLMRKHNGRLFRIARAILKDESDAEDVLQDAYLGAYRHIQDFRGDSHMAWLTRIVVNQALMRLRKEKRRSVIVAFRPMRTDEAERREVDVADERSESPSSRVLRAAGSSQLSTRAACPPRGHWPSQLGNRKHFLPRDMTMQRPDLQ